ncbi:MAG TPA: EAL domain-containing protein [Candidatus Limnocylindria bacterium]|jgi:EAL domain-containing protein (putative c-di-GMP-specific phosphodiesterase class I)|nr:EAL domain-containing protein [Candidatus Limnocylindria bacterium]
MAIVRLRAGDLRDALEAGALSLHYQPQVEVATGKLAGVEAFVRWPHPVYGMIGPSDIVPLVDQAGLHVEFDRWVVGEICAQAKRWGAERVTVPVVAANVWSQTLRHPDTLKLMDALAQTKTDPKTIELECPRGSTADATLVKALVSLRALGVRLASEEYASGARPAGKLRFDTLKIPYPISRDHAASADAIRAVVAEAKKTGARVVADSVETPEQEAALVALGVGIVQGYLYGPEVTPTELRTLMTRPGA